MPPGTGGEVVPEEGYSWVGVAFLGGVAFLAGALAFFAVVALPGDSFAGAFFALVFFAGAAFLAAELFLPVDAFLAGAVFLAGDEVSAGATSLVGPGVDVGARGACFGAVGVTAGAVRVVGAEVGCGDVAVLGARSGGDARMARSSACAAPATRTSNPNRRNNRRLTTARLTPPDPQRTDHVLQPSRWAQSLVVGPPPPNWRSSQGVRSRLPTGDVHSWPDSRSNRTTRYANRANATSQT